MNVLTPHESGFIHGARACYGVPCPRAGAGGRKQRQRMAVIHEYLQRAQHDRVADVTGNLY